ncbi:GGDEF domain-containing protein [Stutzerimonas stutzeri]|uniref:GGDEF domain-containing protein n=1 Tax=Stutzerimonas sp. S1 TaxID=3030652 RepID=UPI002224B6AE|nr:GGDEF domain-containing protein [Stutzerimonas sp. S1]MCW3149703.1 GGDEF domain-containing protein [Stutzerimonas sp. S1]
MLTKRRRSFTGFIALSLVLTGFSAQLLFKSEVRRWETRFAQHVQNVSGAVRNHLDTNEAVLAGFSAFLQAVEQSDADATARYAAAVVAAYPQIYMLEVARGVPLSEQYGFEKLLRLSWRADFKLKDFPSLTQRPALRQVQLNETWPLLFMHPELPQASALYGVRLETVDYLSHALAKAKRTVKPVATPVFAMYEGGNAYILLQRVKRSEGMQQRGGLNFFGSTMVALLLTRTDSLLAAVHNAEVDHRVRLEALLKAGTGVPQHLFSTESEPTGALDRLLLPLLQDRVEIRSLSQPTTLLFERQLRLGDVLTFETLTLLAILAGALVLLPVVLVRHFRTIELAEREHERSVYLATHDVLTRLPNRHLLADRFGEAYAYWQRHGTPFALMVVDLDHFKDINDRFGHEIGDQVLQTVADRMRHATRAYDTVARYGGDEFVVLVRDLATPADAEAAGRQLLQAINLPIETAAGTQSVSCSIGIALCPSQGETFDALLTAADQAMYRIKQRGREGIALSDSSG